jgi:hypothetical protein
MKRGFLKAALAFVRLADLLAAGLQQHAQQAAHLLLVVDDEGFAHDVERVF